MRVIQLDEVDTVKKTKICSLFTLKLKRTDCTWYKFNWTFARYLFKYDKTENSIEWVYNDFENNNLKSDYLIKRSILCTTNRNVNSINKQILTKLSDETSISYSTNTSVNEG